jgi:hypothetical protein
MVLQSDQKVSLHLMIYCNRQVYRDFLIILYNRVEHKSTLSEQNLELLSVKPEGM